MSDYILGGWSQNTNDTPPDSFTYTMYGMITNLHGLTSGTPESPGWSPRTRSAPNAPGKVMWTYGGGGCTPSGMPSDGQDVNNIIAATLDNGWDGVDIDDECFMNVDMIIDALGTLKSQGKQTSYTFLAGWDYNNPSASSVGEKSNAAVQKIAASDVSERFILMCYAASMWSMEDIEANVGPAIERTIAHGVPPKQVILALTPRGLTQENLAYFLDQVKCHDIGGLFIWNFPMLKSSDLRTIESSLLGR